MTRKNPTGLSEEQARRLWQRAAELQAEAAAREDPGEGEVAEGPHPEEGQSGYSLVHVRQAALEAGIQAEFLDLALAEEALLELEGGARETRTDRAARRFLGHPENAVEIRRTFPFPAARVWPVLERTLTTAPHYLDVLEVRGGDPRAGGVVSFEIPSGYQNVDSLQNAAAFSEVRRLLLRLVPEGDGTSCNVLIRAPLRRSRRVSYVLGVPLSGVGGLAGGGTGLAIAAVALGSGGLAAAVAVGLAGVGVVGGWGLTRTGIKALHRWGLRVLERSFRRVLSRVERELQREEEEKKAMLEPGEPPRGQAG